SAMSLESRCQQRTAEAPFVSHLNRVTAVLEILLDRRDHDSPAVDSPNFWCPSHPKEHNVAWSHDLSMLCGKPDICEPLDNEDSQIALIPVLFLAWKMKVLGVVGIVVIISGAPRASSTPKG